MEALLFLLDGQQKELKALEGQLARVRKKLEAKGDETKATTAMIAEQLRAQAPPAAAVPVENPSSPCSPPHRRARPIAWNTWECAAAGGDLGVPEERWVEAHE